MKLSFQKYHGTGNDFIMVDDRENEFNDFPVQSVKTLCSRRFGIGSDGLIFIRKSDEADFEMEFFNPDGSKSFCGNGSRCAVDFAHKLGMIDKSCTFKAVDGIHDATWSDQEISIHMNDVKESETGIDHYFIHTGSPHFIVYRDEIDSIDLIKEARIIRYGERFKGEGTNVNLVSEEEGGVYVRTYERGVEDETFSCGTGVTAVALSYQLRNPMIEEVKVRTRGGNLKVNFQSNGLGGFSNIRLSGPATFVFEGEIEMN